MKIRPVGAMLFYGDIQTEGRICFPQRERD